MAQVFGLLLRTTRVDFSEYKPPTIGRRVARRMALHKIEKLADYVALLQKDRNEIGALYQDLLINVTSFFRDPDAFEALKRVVYPELLKQREKAMTPIRIWVPGCSTGEETYSTPSLMEFLGEERMEAPVQIFGTDLSDNAIERARAGRLQREHRSRRLAEAAAAILHRVDSGYQISKTIRDMCIFARRTYSPTRRSRSIDLVSCRTC